jgi:hypothetical protein
MEKGVLTLRANVSTTYDCKREGLGIIEALDLSARIQDRITDSNKVPAEEKEIPTQEPPRSMTKSKEMKEVELIIGDRRKTAQIGAHLNPK